MKKCVLAVFGFVWFFGMATAPLQAANSEKPMRALADFQKGLTKSLTPAQAIAVFGEPDRKKGSGLIIYEYDLSDGSKLRLGFPGLAAIQYAQHVSKTGEAVPVPLK